MKKKLFNDFIAWLKNPNPDTTLVNWWKRKRAKDREKAERERPAKLEQKAKAEEEYQESIRTEAYLLWEADGKPEGKDDYYWKLARDKITGKNKEPDPYYPEPGQHTRKQEIELAEAKLDYCQTLYSMEMKRKEVLETKAQFYLSFVTLFLGAILLKLEFFTFLQKALAQNQSIIWLNLIILLSTLALGLFTLTSLVAVLMALRLQNYRNQSFSPLFDQLFHPNSPYKDKLILLRDVAAMYALATQHNIKQNFQKTRWIKLTSISVLSLIISLTILMGGITFLLLK